MRLPRIGVLIVMFLTVTVDLGFAKNNAELKFAKGVEYAVQEEFRQAKEEFEKALKIESFNEKAKEALRVIKGVDEKKLKHKVALCFFKGIAYTEDRHWIEAIAEFNRAIELNLRFSEAYNNRGIVYGIKGEYDKAIFDFERAIEIGPQHARPYNSRGVTYNKKGEYDKAISDFTKAIEINPRYAKAYYSRGDAYAKKGQYDQAISDLSKAIEMNPRDAGTYNNRGLAYVKGKRQYAKAILDFSKAIEIEPRYADAYRSRGVAYFHVKKYEKAWDDVHKVQSLKAQVHPDFLKALRQASGRQK